MDIMIIATKGCSHCKNLKKELDDLGLSYEVKYAEECPELVEKYQIRHSPNLIVNGTVAFRRQPTEGELKDLLKSSQC